MFDPATAASLLAVGATTIGSTISGIAGTEVVKEVTKDAYKSFKTSLNEICGRSAERALQKIEEDPASATAREQLEKVLSGIDSEDAGEVDCKYQGLLAAVKEDAAAQRVGEIVASIKIDVESDGKVNISSISGVQTIEVKAKSKKDFNFSNVDMNKVTPSGN